MYEPRTYREQMAEKGFSSCTVSVGETDLWIGIPEHAYGGIGKDKLIRAAGHEIRRLRAELNRVIESNREFLTSLVPIETEKTYPEIALVMANAARNAGTGPMAAVAGAMSETVGRRLLEYFSLGGIIVENGGDIWAAVDSDIRFPIFAGTSVLSGRLGLLVPRSMMPVGVCTSSGTVGHSLSLGKADAVTIICSDTAGADALATAYGNRIRTPDDIDAIIEELKERPEILGALIIKDDKAAACGSCEVQLIDGKN